MRKLDFDASIRNFEFSRGIEHFMILVLLGKLKFSRIGYSKLLHRFLLKSEIYFFRFMRRKKWFRNSVYSIRNVIIVMIAISVWILAKHMNWEKLRKFIARIATTLIVVLLVMDMDRFSWQVVKKSNKNIILRNFFECLTYYMHDLLTWNKGCVTLKLNVALNKVHLFLIWIEDHIKNVWFWQNSSHFSNLIFGFFATTQKCDPT